MLKSDCLKDGKTDYSYHHCPHQSHIWSSLIRSYMILGAVSNSLTAGVHTTPAAPQTDRHVLYRPLQAQVLNKPSQAHVLYGPSQTHILHKPSQAHILFRPCHLLLTKTASATDPPPDKSPTMHLWVLLQRPQKSLIHREALYPRCDIHTRTQTDKSTYRLNWPRGWFSENSFSHNINSIAIKLRFSKKNPAYGRHQLSRPMRIIGPIQIWRGCVIYLKKKKMKNKEIKK